MEYLNKVTRKTNVGNFLLLYLKITDLTYSIHLNLNTIILHKQQYCKSILSCLYSKNKRSPTSFDIHTFPKKMQKVYNNFCFPIWTMSPTISFMFQFLLHGTISSRHRI